MYLRSFDASYGRFRIAKSSHIKKHTKSEGFSRLFAMSQKTDNFTVLKPSVLLSKFKCEKMHETAIIHSTYKMMAVFSSMNVMSSLENNIHQCPVWTQFFTFVSVNLVSWLSVTKLSISVWHVTCNKRKLLFLYTFALLKKKPVGAKKHSKFHVVNKVIT